MATGPYYSNQFAGRCAACGKHVAAEAGKVEKVAARFQVYCLPCPTPHETAADAGMARARASERASKPLAWFCEVLTDALARPDRLTPWERNFCTNNQARLDRQGSGFFMSPEQQEALERIEKKIYATTL